MKKRYSYVILLRPLAVLISLSTMSILSWVCALQPLIADAESFQAYPTGIPWIENEADCENSGRIWQENVCWDMEHDPVF